MLKENKSQQINKRFIKYNGYASHGDGDFGSFSHLPLQMDKRFIKYSRYGQARKSVRVGMENINDAINNIYLLPILTG